LARRLAHSLLPSVLACALALLAVPALASAACTITAQAGSADWNTAATWLDSNGTARVPDGTDNVCIPSGLGVTATTAGANIASTLDIAQGASLVVNVSMSIPGSGSHIGGDLVINGGSVALGDTVYDGGSIQDDGSLMLLGSFTLDGALDIAGSGTLVAQNASSVTLASVAPGGNISPAMQVDGAVTSTGPVTLTQSGSMNASGSWTIGFGTTLTMGAASPAPATSFNWDGAITDNGMGGKLELINATYTATSSTAYFDVSQMDVTGNSLTSQGVDFSTGSLGSAHGHVGDLRVDSGTFEVDAPFTSRSVTLTGGALLLNDDTWSAEVFSWAGGDVTSGSNKTFSVGALDLAGGGARTLGGANLSVAGGTTALASGTLAMGGQTLTLGTGAHLVLGIATIQQGGAIVNHGIIETPPGFTATIQPAVDTADGEIDVGSSATLFLQGGTPQLSGGALTAGKWVLAGTLKLPGAVTTLSGNVQFAGTQAHLVDAAGANDALTNATALAQGSTLTLAAGVTLAPPSGFTNDGTLVLNGGALVVGPTGSFQQNQGALLLSDAASHIDVIAGGNENIAGCTLGGVGTVNGDVTAAGTVAPGNTPGTLTINGNYTQAPGATLNEEIASASDYDRLVVNGAATLDGTIAVVPVGGYVPPNGQTFDVITATSSTGTFQTVDQPAGPAGAFYDPAYPGGATAFRLTANSVSIDDVTHAEGNRGTTAYTFTISLGQAAPATASVDWATQDGSATAGSDYDAASGTVTFAPGETAKTVTVTSRGDTAVEPDENFAVNLSNPAGTRIADGNGVGTITNDDSPQAAVSQVPAGDIDGFPVAPPPVQGKAVNVDPVKGSVLVKLPGKTTFVPLPDAEQVPVGTTVDAREGTVRLFSVAKGGRLQSADFYEGVFQVQQKPGQALTQAKLVGGSFRGCPKASRATSAAKRRRTSSVRHLWGSGSGQFRTAGRFASATIRGTRWLTDDRCNGTLVRVTAGAVTVRDLTLGKTFALKKPKSYLAPAVKPKKR
jgi:hypothetical protein